MVPANARLSWNSLRAIRWIICAMSAFGLLVMAVAAVWAVNLRIHAARYLNLVVPNDGRLWPTVMIAAVLPCAVVHAMGLRTYLTFTRDKQRRVEGQGTNRTLFLHVILCLASGCIVAAINVACFLRSTTTFQQKMRDRALIEAIENYGSDVAAREIVDAVQIEFACCGVSDYKDWYRIPWTEWSSEYEEYQDEEEKPRSDVQSTEKEVQSSSLVEDVPFSCCSDGILESCGRKGEIIKASESCDPKEISIDGCRDAILSRARVIAFFLLSFLLLLSLYQFVLALLCRLFQTAYSNDFRVTSDKNSYRVWLFGGGRDDGGDFSPCSASLLREQRRINEVRSPSCPLSICAEIEKIEEKSTRNGGKSTKSIQVDLVSTMKNNSSEKVAEEIVYNVKNVPSAIFTPKQQMSERIDAEANANVQNTWNFPLPSTPPPPPPLPPPMSVTVATPTTLPPPIPPPLPSFITDTGGEEEEEEDEDIVIDSPSKVLLKKSRSLLKVHNKAEIIDDTLTPKPSRHRRKSLLEKFQRTWNPYTRRRGGGETLMRNSKRSTYERIPPSTENDMKHKGFRPADAYDRFRGTFQDTLTRREHIKKQQKPVNARKPVKMFHFSGYRHAKYCATRACAKQSSSESSSDRSCNSDPSAAVRGPSSPRYPRPSWIAQRERQLKIQHEGEATQRPTWILSPERPPLFQRRISKRDKQNCCCCVHGRNKMAAPEEGMQYR